MRIIPDKTRRNSDDQTPGQSGYIGNDTKNAELKKLIRQANSVDITNVFIQYDIKLDQFNKKICCPMPFHNERSASFYYYPDTNSFYCFGCKAGGGAVEFEAAIKNIDKEQAAKHILNMFDIDIVHKSLDQSNSLFQQRQKQYLRFAEIIKAFITKYNEDKALEYIEKITLAFDTITNKNSLSIDGLQVLIDKLEDSIRKYV